jgi:uncharacterized cupin superfamily protein
MVLELPPTVVAYFTKPSQVIEQWSLGDAIHSELSEALGRALSSADTAGFVAKKRLAFALGDKIEYPTSSHDASALIGGNTAIVQRLERSDFMLSHAASKLSKQIHRRVSLSAYVADPGARAFSWHVDKWDNIVIQLRGRKAFDLADGTSHELSPGDALFLPIDVSHRARTLERSIHLSVVCFPHDHLSP